MSNLAPGGDDLHYSDRSHRWMCPWLNATEADELLWSQRIHVHQEAHRAGMASGPGPRPEIRRISPADGQR